MSHTACSERSWSSTDSATAAGGPLSADDGIQRAAACAALGSAAVGGSPQQADTTARRRRPHLGEARPAPGGVLQREGLPVGVVPAAACAGLTMVMTDRACR